MLIGVVSWVTCKYNCKKVLGKLLKGEKIILWGANRQIQGAMHNTQIQKKYTVTVSI